MSWSACCGSLLRRPEQQVTVDVERSQAAPEGTPPTSTAAVQEEGRLLLRRDTESQQYRMKGREKLQQQGISPSTTGLHQNQPTRDQDFQQEWAR